MKNIQTYVILALLILLTSCGSNYYLKRAKMNTMKAIARGAKIDSLKTIVHDTITVQGISDIKPKQEVRIDTVRLKELCPEVKTPQQQKKLQKAVCPDVGIDTTYRINVIVDGLKHPVLIHVIASSRAGETNYSLTIKPVKMGYKKSVISTTLNPSNGGIKWYHLLIVGICCLLVGFIIGKVFSIGIKL